MNLYEITTGRCGESYERCYVWAEDEESARMIFAVVHGRDHRCDGVNLLFRSESSAFCTGISDNGFAKPLIVGVGGSWGGELSPPLRDAISEASRALAISGSIRQRWLATLTPEERAEYDRRCKEMEAKK